MTTSVFCVTSASSCSVEPTASSQLWDQLVFLLNALGFGSLAAGAYSMIPLAIAVPALFGLMGTFGIELHVVTRCCRRS
jgi:predicted RND superfamily exporter protein